MTHCKKDRQAYVTVLTNSSYLNGCLVLHKSLMDTNTQIPFFALVPDTASKTFVDRLEKSGISVLKTENFSDNIMSRENKMSYWKETIFKLKIFDLVQFDKIVFLDSDMMILRNLDSLFDCPHMSAVAAGQVMHPEWNRLNSGLMVVNPSHDDYLKLVDCIDSTYEARNAVGEGFGDQDVINECFSEWTLNNALHLPEIYNVMLGYAGVMKKAGQICGVDDIYVYHFTGAQKPWSDSRSDLIVIILKMLKRSLSFLDIGMYLKYRKKLKEIQS